MIIALALALSPMSPASAAGQHSLLGADTASLARIARVPLMDLELTPEKGVRSVKAVRIDFRAGQRTGQHVHPVPTLGVVLKGRIRLQVEGEPVQILKAGDAFFEPANAVVRHFENASGGQPASFAAFYLLGPDDKEIIREMPGSN